jgi:methylmalonyl-CoA mutase cobalamin-binding subunit
MSTKEEPFVFTNIPRVILAGNGHYKYIVTRISKNDADAIVVRGGLGMHEGFHSEILKQLQNELGEDYAVKCLGGGKIVFDSEAKTIRLYGASNAYGVEPNRISTVRMIKDSYPDFDVSAQ